MTRPQPSRKKPGVLLRSQQLAAARARLAFFVRRGPALVVCASLVFLLWLGAFSNAKAIGAPADSGAAAVDSLATSLPVSVDSAAAPMTSARGPRQLPYAWRTGAVRAAWIVRDAITTEDGARRAIRDVADAGIRVAFVQVVGRSDAFYDSDVLPRSDALWRDGKFDPLAVVLEEAKARGVEVHAWVNVYLAWSGPRAPKAREHFVRRHPEWTLAGPDLKPYAQLSQRALVRRKSEGVYLSPAAPAVREHVRRFVREILERYDVAGIHLDYVRYPNPEAGYDAASRAGFEERTGVDCADLVRRPRGLELKLGRSGVEKLRAEWFKFRDDQVTELVSEVSQDLRSIRPSALLTAAVRPNPDEARDFYGQDWALWLREGYIDAAVPMCYVKSTGDFAGIIRRICDRSDARRVLAGVSVYNQGARTAAEKIRAADACGMLGTSIYSWNSIADDERYVQAIAVAMAGPGGTAPLSRSGANPAEMKGGAPATEEPGADGR